MKTDTKPMLRIGPLFTGSLRTLVSIPRELLLYFAAFLALGFLAQNVPAIAGMASFAATFGYFLGQYLLYRVLLRRAGLLIDGRIRYFRFLGMALLLIIPILLGMSFFFLPGLVLAAKWVMAPAYLVAGRGGVIESIGESWNASSGNTVELSVTFFLMCLLYVPLTMVAGAFENASDIGLADVPLGGQMILHAMPVLLMGLSVTAYQMLNDDPHKLADVFA